MYQLFLPKGHFTGTVKKKKKKKFNISLALLKIMSICNNQKNLMTAEPQQNTGESEHKIPAHKTVIWSYVLVFFDKRFFCFVF